MIKQYTMTFDPATPEMLQKFAKAMPQPQQDIGERSVSFYVGGTSADDRDARAVDLVTEALRLTVLDIGVVVDWALSKGVGVHAKKVSEGRHVWARFRSGSTPVTATGDAHDVPHYQSHGNNL